MRRLGFAIVLTFAAFAGGTVAQTLGGAIIQRAVALVLPSIIYNPLNSNPSNTAATQQGGPLGANAIGINGGSLNVWNGALYGWGGSVTGLCVLTGGLGANYPGTSWQQLGNCPINGGVGGNNNGFATSGRDNVGGVVAITSQTAQFGALNGTFTATTFVPLTPLNATQLSNMRVGMAIDTNDASPCSGIISGWANDGSSVTVPAWYVQPGGGACTPVGSAATINQRWKLFGMNVVARRDAGGEPKQSIGTEFDCGNNSGVDDTGIQEVGMPTPYDGCIDLVNIYSNIASFGLITRGKFNSGITLNHTGLYGINLAPMTITAGGAPIVANLITPATSSATCTTGSIEWDANFIYICTATNTLKRATLAAF